MRARQEHAPRVLAKAQANHAEALVRTWPTSFDPARPWNAVWRMLCASEGEWWDELIHRPGNRVVSGSANVEQYIDGDVLTTAAGGRGSKRQAAAEEEEEYAPFWQPPMNPGPGRRRGAAGGAGGGKGGKPPKGDLSEHNGRVYTKTRAGISPCAGFQIGQCNRVNNQGRCANDHHSAHQCNICLMVGHGSSDRAACPKQKVGKTGGKGAGDQGPKGGKGGFRPKKRTR